MGPFSALLALCAGNSPVPVNSPHNGQWRGALMFSLICVWINDWVNNREAGDLRRHRGHYGVNVMEQATTIIWTNDGLVYWRIYASLDLNGLDMTFVMEDKARLSQPAPCCWWPGDAMSQDNNSHGIPLDIPMIPASEPEGLTYENIHIWNSYFLVREALN